MIPARLPADLSPSAWARRLAAAREDGRLLNLTVSNPHEAGIVAEALGGEPIPLDAAAPYTPDPRGLLSAREVLAADYAGRGISVSPDRLFLTASTSESWSVLFKALTDPGDAVLVPTPGYPLLETLAPLDGLEVVPYACGPGSAWRLDEAALTSAIHDAGATRIRILAAITPSNPLGRFLRRSEHRVLERAAAALDDAWLVFDEVFARYPLAPLPDTALPSAIADPGAPAFVLDGLSKSCGLPGVKLGWIAAVGHVPDEILARLEHVNDAYLSASAPAQAALPRILEAGGRIRAAVQDRTAVNLARLRDLCASPSSRWTLEPPEAGWTAVLRHRATDHDPSGPDLADSLLDRDVHVHPGWLFDLPDDRIVVSLLAHPDLFAEALLLLDARTEPARS